MPASEQERLQIELILATYDNVAVFPDDWAQGDVEAEYLYRTDKLVVRPEAVDTALENSRGRGADSSPDDIELEGAVRLNVPGFSGDGPALRQELLTLQGELGREQVGFDALLFACIHSCAAIEPLVPGTGGAAVPPVQDGLLAGDALSQHGVGVHVRILDTGLVHEPVQTWMQGVTGDPDSAVDSARDGQRPLPQDGGHGTFTAGCVRVAAPQARVHVVDAAKLITSKAPADVDRLGAIFDSDLAALIRTELASEDRPDILVVNFAGTTLDNQPPVALTALYEGVIRGLREELVIFCPAGNEGDVRVTWPAAFEWVEAVGALGDDGQRAPFSNHGSFVKVYAPGENVTNAYPEGEYQTLWALPSETREFHGLARWSGTSFSTPLVAGLVAARRSTTGQSSRAAWESLLATAEQHRVQGAGPALFPGQELA
jgi:subtilisin family serine protease